MVKQDWLIVVAGHDLVDRLDAETKAKCEWTGYGYNSDQLCALQREQSRKGIEGCEIVQSNYGHSVRADSGLQNFALLHSGRGQTLADAEQWAREWVARAPDRRYAWRRKIRETVQ